jgi:hypothetical protein
MYRAKRETISYIAIQILTMRKEQRENSGSEENEL